MFHAFQQDSSRVIDWSGKTSYIGFMIRRIIFGLILVCIPGLAVFGQTSAIRDYVGMISQTFHPDIVSYMEKFQENLQKRGYGDAAKSIDHFLKGDSGTGFVYVAPDGNNYIITNYHVISQAHSLSVTFEKIDGEQSKFSDLTIVAADEEMDIALLAFAGGQNPFRQGLAFLNRAMQEGDDVYTAGFPQLGTVMIWQLGRGMVSNASVRLPDVNNPGKTFGPFIQHTAQVDPGNSGGPLLVQTQGVPTGFAVAGINTLSARYRQAANYSIPLSRVRSFLDTGLKARTDTDLDGLNERLDSFIKGLGEIKAVYPHIAAHLSNACTAENAEYALSEMIEKAPSTVQIDIIETFVNSPVEGMSYAVAWTIENALRSRLGKITIAIDSVTALDGNNYTVSFSVNDKIIASEWTNEYGIWRIKTFGNFAAGDKSLVRKKAEKKAMDKRLHDDPGLQIAPLCLVYSFENGISYGAEIIFRNSNMLGYGGRVYLAQNYKQFEGTTGLYVPIKVGSVAFTIFGSVGAGFQIPLDGGVSLQGGFQFTTAAVPGLYFTGAYQHNLYFSTLDDDNRGKYSVIIIGLGYAF